MTSFYNNFSLTNNVENKNILKKKFTLNYSDYDKLKMSEQYNKLYSNTYDKNKLNIEINENKFGYLSEIFFI